MVRYSLLNDLARAHRAHVLREATKVRSSSTQSGNLALLLRALWMTLA
jgi:hypothetical protein